MEYRQLGRSGLRVSTITLGTMGFGGTGWATPVGQIDVEGARKQIGLARDAGVNLFDTADVYSRGLSEEILGQALGSDRDEVLIATKVRNTMGDGPNDAGASRHHIIRGAEDSLRRLGTDYIDLYQLHEWDGQTPLEETLHALDHLVQSGKVRYIGCSNYAAWQLMKALWIADREGVTPFVSMQHYYSLQARDIENELVPLAVDQGLGILVWSPIAGGLLSGKYRRGVEAPPGSRHLTEWSEPPVYDEDKLYDTVEELVADWCRSRRLGGPGRAGLHHGQACGDHADRGRPYRGPAGGQSRCRRLDAVGGGGGSVGQGQRPAAAVPVLAPRQGRERSPRPGRSHAAGPSHQGLTRSLRLQ